METFSIRTLQVRFYLKCQLQMKSSEESSKASSEDTSESKEDNSIARERNFLIQTVGKARLTFWTVWEVNKENKGKEWWIQRHTHISQFCEKIAARLPVCIQAPTVLPCVNSLLCLSMTFWEWFMNPAGEKTGHIPRAPFCSEGSVLLYLQRKYWGNGTDSTRNLSSVNSVCSVGGLWPDEAQLSAGNLLLQYTLALGFSLYVYRLRGQTGQRPSPHLIFFKWIYFLITCTCVSSCVGIRTGMLVPTEAREGVGSAGAGSPGGCELHMWVLWPKQRSPTRAMSALNC